MTIGEPAAAATQEPISVAGGQISTSTRDARSGVRPSRIASTTLIEARVPFIFQLPATSGFRPVCDIPSPHLVPAPPRYSGVGGAYQRELGRANRPNG